jgi:hypothetical protein
LVQYSDRPAGSHKAASSRDLAVVQVVGCLIADRSGGWSMTRASLPVLTGNEATSTAELAAAGKIALGDRSYLLLGADVFHPQDHIGQRLAAKGVLIPSRNMKRINVTSLQSLPGPCR